MLDFFRSYFIRPIWEMFFVHFSMPLRAILIIIFLLVILWIIIRLKLFWKELFRFFLEILLLPEYFLTIIISNSPNWLRYGDFINSIALLVIPIKEKQNSKPIKLYWIAYPILILLLIIFPISNCRAKIKKSAPSIELIDNAFLSWSAFEVWILFGEWIEQNDYYYDFISYKVKEKDNLTSIWNIHQNNPNNTISIEEIIWANKSKYPMIKTKIEPKWNLIIPNRKLLSTQNSLNNHSKTIYFVKTRDKSGLHIRALKSLDSNSVAFIPEGNSVELVYWDTKLDFVNGKRGRWARVRTNNGKEGWAWGWFLTK